MKRKIMLIMIALLIVFNTAPTLAKTKNIDVKVVSVKNKEKNVKVKVKIYNNSKKEAEFGNYFELYQKRKNKWSKVSWREGLAFSDEAHVILPGGSVKKTYIIRKKGIVGSLKKCKYQIRFKISGKKKTVNFKL